MAGTEQFGPYTLIEPIAVGGMAEIFRARHEGLGGFAKTVALKRLHPHYSANRQFIEMLIDEARITAELHHPNIVEIFDVGQIGRHFYIAMELIEGRDLFQILRGLNESKRKMPIEAALFLVQEVLAGLHYAHFRRDATGRPLRIIHRDVSPQNILVSQEGEVKLIDFGIAKAERRLTATSAGIIKGKFFYMSPEQAAGLPIDHRSDLFSAGIVLYEALTAEPLYEEGADRKALLMKVQRPEVPPLHDLRPDAPPELDAIVRLALESDPDRRFQTGHEFHRALGRVMAARGSAWSRLDLALYVRELLDPEAEPDEDRTTAAAAPKPSAPPPPAPMRPPERPETPPRQAAPAPATSGPRPPARWTSPATQVAVRRAPPTTDSESEEDADASRAEALAKRERRLRWALAAVVVAILLVAATIAWLAAASSGEATRAAAQPPGEGPPVAGLRSTDRT